MEEYAREHAHLCGNNSEPDPFSVLPRLESLSLVINVWVNVDPPMTHSYTEVANHFYSEAAKKDYMDEYVSDNYDRYHELYAYLQVRV